MRLLLLLIALLIPSLAEAEIDNRTSCAVVAGGTTRTLSYTNTYVSPIFLTVNWQNAVTITSVTYGSAMTELAAVVPGSSVANLSTFVLASPPTGTNNFVITFSGAPSGVACFALSTVNGNTSTPTRTIYTRKPSDGAGPGRNVTDSVAGDLIYHAVSVYAPTITFASTENSAGTEDDAVGGGSGSAGVATLTAVGANTAVDATNASLYGEIAFAVQAPGGGGPVCIGTSPTWTATIDQASVSDCINRATDADTINVGAGSASWSGLTFGSKNVRLVGAGIGVSNITLSSVMTWCSDSLASRISGFSFNTGAYYLQTSHCSGFRIDHNAFTRSTTAIEHINLIGSRAIPNEGLIDHNTFMDGKIVELGQGTGTSGSGDTRWSEPLNWGTSHAVYIEDNEFSISQSGASGLVVDGNRGSRMVARFNTLHSGRFEQHSMQGGANRAVRLWEFYGNSMENATYGAKLRPFFVRGGTGMIFHNTTDGLFSNNNLNLNNLRSAEGADPGNANGFNFCVGTEFVDGNTPTFEGWPCRDQIGRSLDASLWDYTNPAPSQASQPAYMWRNTRSDTGNDIDVTMSCGAADAFCTRQGTLHILSDRDFYKDSLATGAPHVTGVREGTAATMNAIGTCTQGVGFWVTNEGSWNTSASNPYGVNAAGADGRLYVCGASNNWVLTYTPYTYPHPLQLQFDAGGPPVPVAIGATNMALYHTATMAIFQWPVSVDANHKAYKVYRCTQSGACSNLIATITPASAALAHQPENRYVDSSLYVAATYYYSVADQNTSDYIGPTGTPVSVIVTGKP